MASSFATHARPEDSSHIRANVADVSMTVVNAIWLVGLGVLGVAGLIAIWRDVDDPIARMLEFSLVMTGIVPRVAAYAAALPRGVLGYCRVAGHAVVEVDRPARSASRADGSACDGPAGECVAALLRRPSPALIYEAASPYTIGGLILYAVLVAMTRARKSAYWPDGTGCRSHGQREPFRTDRGLREQAMTFIDTAIVDATEALCHRFQVLTGRTNVWLAIQLTNLSIVVYFVWAAARTWEWRLRSACS